MGEQMHKIGDFVRLCCVVSISKTKIKHYVTTGSKLRLLLL